MSGDDPTEYLASLYRPQVADFYPGSAWKERVRQMPDDQVVAIYLRVQQDKVEPKTKEPKQLRLF